LEKNILEFKNVEKDKKGLKRDKYVNQSAMSECLRV